MKKILLLLACYLSFFAYNTNTYAMEDKVDKKPIATKNIVSTLLSVEPVLVVDMSKATHSLWDDTREYIKSPKVLASNLSSFGWMYTKQKEAKHRLLQSCVEQIFSGEGENLESSIGSTIMALTYFATRPEAPKELREMFPNFSYYFPVDQRQ